MIFSWLSTKALFGLAKGWWVVIGVAVVVGAWFAFNGMIDRVTETAKDAGAAEQREANLTETIRNVEKANVAAETMRRDPDASRAECLRNARNPEDC